MKLHEHAPSPWHKERVGESDLALNDMPPGLPRAPTPATHFPPRPLQWPLDALSTRLDGKAWPGRVQTGRTVARTLVAFIPAPLDPRRA